MISSSGDRPRLLRQGRALEVGPGLWMEVCCLARLFYCRRDLLISRGSKLSQTEVRLPSVSLPYVVEPLCFRRTCFILSPLRCTRFAHSTTGLDSRRGSAREETGKAAGKTEGDRIESSLQRHRKTME